MNITRRHVGYYTFTIKASTVTRDWLWLVTYRGEHLAHGASSSWAHAEFSCRSTIANHSVKA